MSIQPTLIAPHIYEDVLIRCMVDEYVEMAHHWEWTKDEPDTFFDEIRDRKYREWTAGYHRATLDDGRVIWLGEKLFRIPTYDHIEASRRHANYDPSNGSISGMPIVSRLSHNDPPTIDVDGGSLIPFEEALLKKDI